MSQALHPSHVLTKKNHTAYTRLATRLIKDNPTTPEELRTALGLDLKTLEKVLENLAKNGIVTHGGALIYQDPPSGRINEMVLGGKWHRIGLVSDTHLCCKEERLEELNLQYDLFAREGIKTVYHAGNICDGYIARINGSSVYSHTMPGQIDYVIKHYPQRKGIVTKLISGADHEGWWVKDTGVSFGDQLERAAKDAGRTDLIHMGFVEADVTFTSKSTGDKVIMKVQHPGGGSAYARSYKAQKQIEAFEGGEKPHILIQGHYHVSNVMMDRNVYVVNMPGFQDQTVFARQKNLRMEVGGAIAEFTVAPGGGVGRFRIEMNRYFTRGFYKQWLLHEVPARADEMI